MSTSQHRVAVTVSVDTNILLDLLEVDAGLRRRALDALNALGDEALVICEAVYSELANRFPSVAALNGFLDEIDVTFVSSSPEVLFLAGRVWATYARTRPARLVCGVCGGETAARCEKCEALLTIRQRVLPDFYVGAHALVNADRLLTRDQRHFRTYFPDLALV